MVSTAHVVELVKSSQNSCCRIGVMHIGLNPRILAWPAYAPIGTSIAWYCGHRDCVQLVSPRCMFLISTVRERSTCRRRIGYTLLEANLTFLWVDTAPGLGLGMEHALFQKLYELEQRTSTRRRQACEFESWTWPRIWYPEMYVVWNASMPPSSDINNGATAARNTKHLK